MSIKNKIANINTIEPGDLSGIDMVLFDAFHIDTADLNDDVANDKQEWLNSFAELLKTIFFNNATLANDSKLAIINLLQKINAQKEMLEMIKSKTSSEDLLIASERLFKKSQSAFELKHTTNPR